MAQKKFNIGNSLKKTGDFIKENPKPLLYIGGALAIVLIGAAIVKRVSKKISGEDLKGGKFNEQEIDYTKTTISKATAKNYAESLFKAFNWKSGPPIAIFGTDKSVIDNIFTKIKPEDFKLIFNEFGERSYGTAGTPDGVEKFFNYYDNLNLVEWLNEELDYFGDSALREKIRKVIEPAGFILEK